MVQNARHEQSLAAYEQTALSTLENLENALVPYAKRQVRRCLLEDAATSSRNSPALVRRLYVNGLTDVIKVLEAECSLYQFQDQLVQSDHAVSVKLIRLYKSLGGGWQAVQHQTSLAQSGATIAPTSINAVPPHYTTYR